jgi:hypothetical protein
MQPDEDEVILRTFVQEDRGELSLLFESQRDDGTWQQHALAHVSVASAADQKQVAGPAPALPQQESLSQPVGHTELSAAASSAAPAARFQCLTWLQSAAAAETTVAAGPEIERDAAAQPAKSALATFRLPAEVAAEAAQYILHPAILEAVCSQLLGHASPSSAALSLTGICVLGRLGATGLVQSQSALSESSLQAQLRLFSPSGELLLHIEELQLAHSAAAPLDARERG